MPHENPIDYVIRVAQAKLNAGLRILGENQSLYPCDPHDVVIAADTTVALDGRILGKPQNKADARRMLLSLSGKIHQVHTAVCCSLASGEKVQSCRVTTEVTFAKLTDAWIESYIESGEPMDKAGGYGIQGAAGAVISGVTGSYTAVVGLPVQETLELISKLKANR